MGGHGGLNILPQKRWNVYNFDNREKVRKDEEAAAREDDIRQQQQRQKDSEARLAKLRDAKIRAGNSGNAPDPTDTDDIAKDQTHAQEIQQMKLFDGLISFQRLPPGGAVPSEEYKGPNQVDKKIFRGDKELERLYKRAAKEATKVGKDGVEADDEHYKLGYGCLDRNRKRPWYLTKSALNDELEPAAADANRVEGSTRSCKKQKKTVAELRDERLLREKQERERAQRILTIHQNSQLKGVGAGNRGRRSYYNSSFGNAK